MNHNFLNANIHLAVDLTPLKTNGENGGVNVFTDFLIESLLSLAPHWQLTLLTSNKNHADLSHRYQQQINTYCIKPSPKTTHRFWQYGTKLSQFLRQFFRLNRTLHQLGIQLLLCPYTNPVYEEPGIPTIAIVHDLQHLALPQAFSWQERLYRQLFFGQLSDRATQIVCISEFTRKAMIKAFPKTTAKLTTIHHGNYRQTLTLEDHQVNQILHDLGLSPQQYFFYPANHWPHKNHRILGQAYRKYFQQFSSPFDLVLTGAMIDTHSQFVQLTQAPDLSSHIHLLGYVDALTLEALWRGCYALVFPSRYEGFGLPILEAMFYQKPVICSHAASLPEVGGDAVLYFNPDDCDDLAEKLAQIATDSELVQSLVEKGTMRLQQFSAQATAQQYLETIINCLEIHLNPISV